MSIALRSVALLALALLAACSRHDPEPAPAPTPSEPWPAQRRPSAQRSQEVRFDVVSRGEATFVSKTRGATHRGTLRVARGELTVDLLNLESTRGYIELDLTSLRVQDDDGKDDRQASTSAQNWFELGSSRPPAARERFRWARFTIESVAVPSAQAAHEGTLRKPDPRPRDAGAGGAPNDDTGEIRTVDLSLKGRLRFHDYDTLQVAQVRATFHYGGPSTAGAVPTKIGIATRSSFPVSLAAYDIRPRDDHGRVIAQQMKLLGTEVAREVRVSVAVEATPAK